MSCNLSTNPCSSVINPDVNCRLCDEKKDGTQLVEFFDSDTNEFKLFIYNSEQEIQIEHPHGKVENFKEIVSSNSIKFDLTDSKFLIVNGKKFAIQTK